MQEPGVSRTESPGRASPAPKILSCVAQLHEMFKQQQALQQQNRMLYDALNALRQDVSHIGQLAPPPASAADSAPLPARVDAHSPAPGERTHRAEPAMPRTETGPGDGHHVSDAVHGGAPVTHHANAPSSPSRAERAHLHAAGLDAAAAPGTASGAPTAAPVMGLEERDVLSVSSIILQFVSFAPSNALNVPRALDKVFLRFRFFDFPPTQTPAYLLDKAEVHTTQQVRRCCSPGWPGALCSHTCHLLALLVADFTILF